MKIADDGKTILTAVEPGGLVGLEMPDAEGSMKNMVFGLEDTDPNTDGTRITIQDPLETGNVDLASQMFIRSKTDANGFFTLKSVVSFFNDDYNPTPGKVLALDPESMSVTAREGTDNQRWRFVGSTLENKAGIWKSNSTWTKRDEKDGNYILENVSKGKFLTRSGKLTSDKGIAQIWKELDKDEEDYFTLEVFPATKATTTQVTRTATGNQVLTAAPNQLTLEDETISEHWCPSDYDFLQFDGKIMKNYKDINSRQNRFCGGPADTTTPEKEAARLDRLTYISDTNELLIWMKTNNDGRAGEGFSLTWDEV